MPLVLRNAAIMAASMTAALLAGAAAQAAPVTYQITGTCEFACNAGTRLAGSMILDQDQPASTVILSSQFTDMRYSVDGGASITPSLRWATGEWGATPGSVQNLEFNAGSTVLPTLGPLTQAALNGSANGRLTGIFIFTGSGACTTSGCSEAQSSIFQTNFNVTATPLVSEPSPVPLPSSLALALASTAILGSIAGWRWRRAAAPA